MQKPLSQYIDVVCRSIEIPEFGEFFAREDTDSINSAILHLNLTIH